MKQWFSGKFRGHYRGKPSEPSALSAYPTAPHFRIEVYEAIISEVELGPLVHDPAPAALDEGDNEEAPSSSSESTSQTSGPTITAHRGASGSALHQSHIGKVHLIDAVRRGQTLRSTAHDVLMSAITLSHPAMSSRGTLGHIEGVISGWYRPPAEPPQVEEVPALDGLPPVGWKTETLDREPGSANPTAHEPRPTSAPPKPHGKRNGDATRSRNDDSRSDALLDDEVETEEQLDAVLSEENTSTEYPFFTLGVAVVLLLGFFATPFAATLFGLTFLFCYGVRRWLLGVVPDVAAIRVVSLFLGSSQILVAALMIARWASVGCVSLSPAPLIWLLGAQMASCLLPRPLPFALTTAGFAAVLLQAYASWSPPHCSTRADVPSPAGTIELSEDLETH